MNKRLTPEEIDKMFPVKPVTVVKCEDRTCGHNMFGFCKNEKISLKYFGGTVQCHSKTEE